jgi:hypothetical protein
MITGAVGGPPFTVRNGKDGYVGEHAVEVEFLLIACASDGCFSLTANREHGRVIDLGIVKTCGEVSGTRSSGRQTKA